jgi:multicomponent K+:H+ antiporter subunit G
VNTLPLWMEWVVAALLVTGGVFALVGAIGMLRFPDFYMRLHAPTKATTLGVGGVLLASLALSWWRGEFGVPELLITLFLFVTAPVSANLLAKAALHLRVPSRAGEPQGAPEQREPKQGEAP